jgi:hypothetical protein
VAQDTDESKTRILPDPELNPLLNPLLAAHMGRWAEVYFTSPPEKRAQAVADLLRELESNPAPESAQGRNEERVKHRLEAPAEEFPPPPSFAAAEFPLTCAACGHDNSAEQRFCGMCGSPLTIAPVDFPSPLEEAPPPIAARWHEPGDRLADGVDDDELSSADSAAGGRNHEIAERQLWPQPEPKQPDVNVLSGFQPEPPSPNYTIYAGAGLAILLAVLGYMTWRGSAASRSGTAPSAALQTAPTSPNEPGPMAATSTPHSVPDNPAPPAAKSSSSETQRTPMHRDQKDEPRVNAQPEPGIPTATASSSTLAPGLGGSQELATAEKYLNAAPGAARDSQQAAAWLWKAVAKQNMAATLLLSDLYLRGDGVTKSCDQARLLLDAAARKGVAAAAERLRNLQAFGCQ